MKKTYLIINENSSDNIGDHAINEGLKQVFHQAEIKTISAPFATNIDDKSAKTRKNNLFGDKSLSIKARLKSVQAMRYIYWARLAFKPVRQCCKNSNFSGAVVGGGQLILSGGTFPIALYIWCFFLKRYGIPFSIVGVGCGEKFSFLDKILIRSALNKSVSVLVRDHDSIEKLNKHFGYSLGKYIPDLAFAIEPTIDIEHKVNDSIVVGATDYEVYLRYWNEVNYNYAKPLSYSEYIESWVDLVLSSLDENCDKVVFSSTTFRDTLVNKDVYIKLKQRCVKQKLVLIDELESLSEYTLHLHSASVVISGRMHGLILGMIYGCTLSPWVISNKIKLFLNDYSDSIPEKLRMEIFNLTLQEIE